MDEKNFNGYNDVRITNFVSEAEEIIQLLKSDRAFCLRFFYGKDKKKCNIARFRSKHIGNLLRFYDVKMSDEAYSTIVYEELWGEGTWQMLETYDKKSTIFVWLRKVAWNVIIDWLEHEHIIPENRSRTVGNTRLAMLSQSTGKCKLIIDELVKHTSFYELLTAIYVDRQKKDEIKVRFGLTEEAYKSQKTAGERILKDAILRSGHSFEEDVLRDKSTNHIMVSSEFVMDLAEWYKERINKNPFSEVLGIHLSDIEVREKIANFICDFSRKLNWTDEERYIWRRRFVENVPPMELAKEMGKDRHWVDQHYSRINKKFHRAFKAWWKKNG